MIVSMCNQYGNTIHEITYMGFWYQVFKIWHVCYVHSLSQLPADIFIRGLGRHTWPVLGETALGQRTSEGKG